MKLRFYLTQYTHTATPAVDSKDPKNHLGTTRDQEPMLSSNLELFSAPTHNT